MKKGIGLIDVLNVLLVGALIASFVIPVFKKKENIEKYKESVASLKLVAKAMERHYLETGEYPAFENYNEIAGTESSLVTGEYIETVPAQDAWGRSYMGNSDGKDYEINGLAVPSKNKKLVNQHNDYKYSTGNKFAMKGGQS